VDSRVQTRSRALSRCLIYAGFFLLAFAYLASGTTRALNIYDEGLILYGAQRVAWGRCLTATFGHSTAPPSIMSWLVCSGCLVRVY